MTREALNTLDNPIDLECLADLKNASQSGPVLILTHDNPDPDALASGKALSHLLMEAWQIPTRLQYSGLVARAENQAMLKLLVPEWEHVDILTDLNKYSAIALVDTQPGAGNNRLPDDILPDIVIDHHHPIRELLAEVAYVDMRPDIGATVSLLHQHLDAAAIYPDADLATAMFYGLQTDTQGLARGASPLDQVVYFELLGFLDHKKLIQVERAGLPREYFRAVNQGLNSTRVYNHSAVAYLKEIHRPDFAAEMADLLIRLNDAKVVLCMGIHDKTLHLSLRTEPSGIDAGVLLQEIIVHPGKAGGHGTMAGGQVPLKDQDMEWLVTEITRRFLGKIGEIGLGEPLLLKDCNE